MPRGGARPGSGPSADPNSARSKARAAKAAKLGLVLASPPAAVLPSQPQAQPAVPDQAAPKTGREQPLELMFRLMTCGDPRIELQAAIAAAPYVHPKFMPVRAKPEPKEKPASRFSTPTAPPRLVVNKP